MSRKRKRDESIDRVVDAVVLGKGESVREIARETGLSKSRVHEIIRLPDAKVKVKARLAAGNLAGQLTGSIGTIVAALGALVDETVERGTLVASDVEELLTLLAALTGTVDRLSRVGVSLDHVVDSADDSALRLLLVETYARAIRWADGRSAAQRSKMIRRLDRMARSGAHHDG